MKYQKGQITFFILSVLLGYVIMVMLYNNPINMNQSTSLSTVKELIKKEKDELEIKSDYLNKIRSLEKRIVFYQNQASGTSDDAKKIQEELEKTKVLVGLTDLVGPGVEIILNDRKKETLPNINENNPIEWYIVHDEDVLKVINELLAAGAEAISINDMRIVSNTRIRCGGPTINVKNQPLAPPFIIHAIGNPDKLNNFLTNSSFDAQQSMSIYNYLTSYGIEFTIRKEENVKVPRFYGSMRTYYAKAINEEGE